MADTLVSPTDGPNGVLATDKPPTRGQWQSIAVLALQVLSLKVPTTRLGAAVTLARLRTALERGDHDPRNRA